jgi:hypothetical protein
LFLDFWHERLPDARYVVLYRHPIEVVLSLMRRAGEFGETFAPLVGLRAWEVYNRRLLSFVERYPERCFVAQVPALTLDLPGFVKQVAAAFDLPLLGGDGSDLFLPSELATGADAPATRPLWEWLLPDAMAIYRRLEERSAVAPPAPAKAPTGALVGDLIRHDLAPLALQETGAQGAVAHLEALFEARLVEERRAAEASIEGVQDQLREVRGQLREAADESAALRRRLAEGEALYAAAAARRDEIAWTLAEIERSRTFGLVAAWWSFTSRFRRLPGPDGSR